MMAVVTVMRPLTGDLFVSFPYRTDSRMFLTRISGPYSRGVIWERPFWRAPRTRMDRIIQGLVDEYGAVTVSQEGAAQTKCVEACWDAKPETRDRCVCGCAGSNHGSGFPLGHEVRPGLSVDTDYSTWTYVVA